MYTHMYLKRMVNVGVTILCMEHLWVLYQVGFDLFFLIHFLDGFCYRIGESFSLLMAVHFGVEFTQGNCIFLPLILMRIC